MFPLGSKSIGVTFHLSLKPLIGREGQQPAEENAVEYVDAEADKRPTDNGRGLLWKIIQFPLVLLILGFLWQVIAIFGGGLYRDWLNPPKDSPMLLGITLFAVSLCLLAHYGFNRFVDKSGVNDVEPRGAPRELGVGLFLGFLLFASIVAIVRAMGGYRISGFVGWYTFWNMAAAFAIAPGVIEEILFRGLLFRYVERIAGSWIALVLSGALFGFAHYANPNGGVVPAIAIALEAGIMLGAVYMLTRRLWAAIGVHMAWNFTQGWIFGLPVSGIDDPGLISAKLTGPEWLTGGAFGLEASVVAMVVATGAGLVLLWMAHKRGRFVAFPNWAKAWREGWPKN